MAGLSKLAGALNAQDFKHAVEQFPRLSDKAREVSRKILVEGKSLQYIEQHCEVSRQQAHQWAKKIHAALMPTGWVSAIVTLPAADMEKVKTMEREAREDLKQKPTRKLNNDAPRIRAMEKSEGQRQNHY